GVPQPFAAQARGQPVQVAGRAYDPQHGAPGAEHARVARDEAGVLRVGVAEDDVGPRDDPRVVAFGDAEHGADDLDRQAYRGLGHEVARPGGDQLVDDPRRAPAYVVLGTGQHARCEGAGDDAADRGVARVVHVDQRAEEALHVRREVRDARRAGLAA